MFASPIPEGAQDRLDATIAHLTSRYALDGLHLDYIRYPSPDFDVQPCARSTPSARPCVPELTPTELATLDARASASPLAFVDLTTRRAGRPSVAIA